MKWLIPLFLSFCFLTSYGQEEILDYRSNITVNLDRSVTVTETIKVRAEGNNIQRGIFRDIPNVMLDENDQRLKVDLEFEEVYLNGSPVNWAVDGITDGKRLKIGDANVFLDPGVYTYTLTYKMGNQVRFFEQYDELYWNATGNQWAFPIKKAVAIINLPDGAEIIQHKGYSGGYGSTGCACSASLETPTRLVYTLDKPLYPYEGITIALGWNKGIIPPPSEAELQKRKMKQYYPLIIMASGLLLLFIYYMFAWTKVGKDPMKGAIFARFDPPDGYSPAAARYVHKMGFDNKAFAASIVSMAVKGYLKIDKSGKHYILHKVVEDESVLSPGEKKIADKLFKSSSSIEVKQSNHSTLSSAIKGLKDQLKQDFKKINFAKNKGWLIPGIIWSIITFVATMVFLVDYSEKFITLMIVFFFSIFFLPIIIKIIQVIKNGALISKIITLIVPLIFIGFAVNLIYGLMTEGVIEWHYIEGILPYIILLMSLIGLNMLFDYLIQAPTVMGRQRMDEIEGLKMYMEVAEKHRFDRLNPPKETPQLFEALLPYAIALGVESAWSKKFGSIIEKAIEAGEYQPGWYVGTHSFLHVNRMSQDLGSNFSSSISSASVSPQSSSSSGSGGGGFSGGGGGGGGGGGW